MNTSKLKSVEDLADESRRDAYAVGAMAFDYAFTAKQMAAYLEKFRILAIQDYVNSLEPSPVVRSTLGVDLYDLSDVISSKP